MNPILLAPILMAAVTVCAFVAHLLSRPLPPTRPDVATRAAFGRDEAGAV